MKVCAMTDKEASTTSWTWTSKMKWGFFSMFTQNLRGKLWRKEKGKKKNLLHNKCSTTNKSHEIKYGFCILISSLLWNLILYFNDYTSCPLSVFHVWKQSLYNSARKIRKAYWRRILSTPKQQEEMPEWLEKLPEQHFLRFCALIGNSGSFCLLLCFSLRKDEKQRGKSAYDSPIGRGLSFLQLVDRKSFWSYYLN